MPNTSQACASSAGGSSPACSRLCASTARASASARARAGLRGAAGGPVDHGRHRDRRRRGRRTRANAFSGSAMVSVPVRRHEEEVESRSCSRAAGTIAGRRPPTSAVATTTSHEADSDSVGSPCRSGVTSSSPASAAVPSTADGVARRSRRRRARASARGRLPGVPARLVVGDDVHVDVAGLGDHRLADAGTQQGRQPAAAAGADQDLGGVHPAGEVEDRRRRRRRRPPRGTCRPCPRPSACSWSQPAGVDPG